MTNKIRNLYDVLEVVIQINENNEFILYTIINGDKLITKVSCSKYAKFLINDLKSLEHKYGLVVYSFDPLKIKALFSISEEYLWFSRKELVEFITYEIQTNKKIL